MNFSQLKARAAVLCQLEGWSEVSPAPDYAYLVNRAWEMFSYDSECFVTSENVSTVIGQAEYSLTNSYKNLLDVTYSGSGLLRSDEAFERNLNPGWRVQASGTPSRWVLSGFNKLTLVPPPSAIQTLNVRGAAYGTALSSETDTPSCPSVYHEAIAIKAAILHGEIYAQGDAMQRIERLGAMYNGMVQQCRLALLQGYERRAPQEP